MRVLVAGASARAVAESVMRAGHEPVAADMFGDRDLLRIAPWRKTGEGDSLASIALDLRADGVVFASGVENNPALADELRAAGVRVFAPEGDAIRRARDPGELDRICARHGIARPRSVEPARAEGPCVVKPLRSAAGIGIRDWGGDPADVAPDECLQEKIEGVPLSAVFVADGGRAVLLGASRQFAGEAFLGARGYAWCGNLMPFAAEGGRKERLAGELRRTAAALVSELGLAGACGVDFVLRGETPFLLEINPRICASFELVELLLGVNAFRLHQDALEGRLPEERDILPDGPFRGKGIVYAPHDMTAPDTGGWIGTDRHDIPQAGSPLPAGAPICTVISPPMGDCGAVRAFLRREALNVWKECAP